MKIYFKIWLFKTFNYLVLNQSFSSILSYLSYWRPHNDIQPHFLISMFNYVDIFAYFLPLKATFPDIYIKVYERIWPRVQSIFQNSTHKSVNNYLILHIGYLIFPSVDPCFQHWLSSYHPNQFSSISPSSCSLFRYPSLSFIYLSLQDPSLVFLFNGEMQYLAW